METLTRLMICFNCEQGTMLTKLVEIGCIVIVKLKIYKCFTVFNILKYFIKNYQTPIKPNYNQSII